MKNFYAYRLDEPMALTSKHTDGRPTPDSPEIIAFYPIFGKGDERVVEQDDEGGMGIFTMQILTLKTTSSAKNKAIMGEVDAFREANGFIPTKDQMREIREKVMFKLLSEAPVGVELVHCFYNKHGHLFISTPSTHKADKIISWLIHNHGLQARAISMVDIFGLTNYLQECAQQPEAELLFRGRMFLDDEAVLRNREERVSFKKDYQLTNAKAYVAENSETQVSQIRMTLLSHPEAAFTLTESGAVKNIKYGILMPKDASPLNSAVIISGLLESIIAVMPKEEGEDEL